MKNTLGIMSYFLQKINSQIRQENKETKKSFTIIFDEDLATKDLTKTAKLLRAYIRRFSRKYGYCFATNRVIAKTLGVCSTTISNSLQLLKKKGYVNITNFYYVDKYGRKHIERRIYLKELVCVEGELSKDYEKVVNETPEETRKEIESEVNSSIENKENPKPRYKNIEKYREIHYNWDSTYKKNKYFGYYKANPPEEKPVNKEQLAIIEKAESKIEKENPPELVEKLKKSFTLAEYDCWLKGVKISLENGVVVLRHENKFILDQVKNNFFYGKYKDCKLVKNGLREILKDFFGTENIRFDD